MRERKEPWKKRKKADEDEDEQEGVALPREREVGRHARCCLYSVFIGKGRTEEKEEDACRPRAQYRGMEGGREGGEHTVIERKRERAKKKKRERKMKPR